VTEKKGEIRTDLRVAHRGVSGLVIKVKKIPKVTGGGGGGSLIQPLQATGIRAIFGNPGAPRYRAEHT